MPIRLRKITWLLIAVGWDLAADPIDAADAVNARQAPNSAA